MRFLQDAPQSLQCLTRVSSELNVRQLNGSGDVLCMTVLDAPEMPVGIESGVCFGREKRAFIEYRHIAFQRNPLRNSAKRSPIFIIHMPAFVLSGFLACVSVCVSSRACVCL